MSRTTNTSITASELAEYILCKRGWWRSQKEIKKNKGKFGVFWPQIVKSFTDMIIGVFLSKITDTVFRVVLLFGIISFAIGIILLLLGKL